MLYDSVAKLARFEHPPIGAVELLGLGPVWLDWLMMLALAWSAARRCSRSGQAAAGCPAAMHCSEPVAWRGLWRTEWPPLPGRGLRGPPAYTGQGQATAGRVSRVSAHSAHTSPIGHRRDRASPTVAVTAIVPVAPSAPPALPPPSIRDHGPVSPASVLRALRTTGPAPSQPRTPKHQRSRRSFRWSFHLALLGIQERTGWNMSMT
jgi:hypothetical protein